VPSLTPLRDAVAERVTLTQVGTALVLAVALHQLFGVSLPQVAIATVVTAVVGLGDVAREAYDVREAVAHGWNGALAFAGTGLLYALGEDPPLWFLAVFGSIGAWFLADAVQTARHEGVIERERDGREVYRDYVARQVHETLDERPQTRRELHDALDADAETVDAAVADLREREVVAEVGSELRVDESDESAAERVAGRLAGLARRIARPITLEFRAENAEKKKAGVERGEAATDTDRTHDSAAPEFADPDSEREREPSQN